MTNQIIWKIQSLHNQGKFIEKLAFLDILYMIWTFYRFLSLIFMKYVYFSFIHERILIEADKSFYRWYLSDKINFAKMIQGLQKDFQHLIIQKMDIEKNLFSTYDQEFILKDHFIHNGLYADLYIYEDHITYSTQLQTNVLRFDQDTLFEVHYQEQQCQGIKFFFPEQFSFLRENWLLSQLWENYLLKKIKQKNFHQYFRPIKKIGKGNFASVYLAHNKRLDTLVAVKAFVKDIAYKNNGKRALDNQINLLRKLSNSNILKLYGVYETGNSLYIVTEYIEGMTLEVYLKVNQGKINYEQRRSIIRMILKGLAQMQRKGVLHRDLKPQNIMISKDGKNLRIVDYGLATQTNLEKYIFVRCGTPGYVAPQILRIKDDQKPVLDTISDMFSLGSIFYQMIFQKKLFDALEHEDVLNQNRACVIRFTQEMKNSISFDEANLLQKMLTINPKNRISASQAIQHNYISQKTVNIFGSMRNRISKPIYIKASRKQITSLDKNENLNIFKSLQK